MRRKRESSATLARAFFDKALIWRRDPMARSLLSASPEADAIMLTAKGVGTVVAGAALLAALIGSSGLADRAGSSLLLAFGAVVALTLTRHNPR